MSDDRPIGIFDSGVGGLTVLDRLIDVLPRENFYYVADRGYCPYGSRSAEYVCGRVGKIALRLSSMGVKIIIAACNTASLRISCARAVTDLPVIGVIGTACERAIEITRNRRVAILATEATIKSSVYQDILSQSGVTPIPLACGEFVDFLENGDPESPEARVLVAAKLAPIKDEGFDTLIHGCTHFDFLEPLMREVLGDVNYVGCGAPLAKYLKRYLAENGLENRSGRGDVRIFATGGAENAVRYMKRLGAERFSVARIDIR